MATFDRAKIDAGARPGAEQTLDASAQIFQPTASGGTGGSAPGIGGTFASPMTAGAGAPQVPAPVPPVPMDAGSMDARVPLRPPAADAGLPDGG